MSAVVKSKTELGEELEIAFTPELARRDPERYLDYALALQKLQTSTEICWSL